MFLACGFPCGISVMSVGIFFLACGFPSGFSVMSVEILCFACGLSSVVFVKLEFSPISNDLQSMSYTPKTIIKN